MISLETTRRGTTAAFASKRSGPSNSVEVFEKLEHVEKLTMEASEADLGGQLMQPSVAKMPAELFDLWCQSCIGEAWRSSAASTLCQGFVARQPSVREGILHEVDTALRKWESNVALLSKEFEEVVPNSMKIAIVAAMMPV